jgi:hypothetical protein
MTLEAWVRVDVIPNDGPAVGGFATPDAGQFLLAGSPNAGDKFVISTPSTDNASGPPTNVTGVWKHLAGTYDGATLRVYVNGVLVGSKAKTGNVSDVTELRICRFPRNVNSYLNGAIDEVRVWNVVRSASQILNNYQHQLHGDEPGLIGYYRFDEGSGQLVVDSSNAGNDGYLGSSTTAGTDDPTRVMSSAPLMAPGPCVRDTHTACLLDDRFEVKVEMWNLAMPPTLFPGHIQTYQGASSETEQTASFYSFQEGNVEVFVKMVAACAHPSLPGFWLFAAGATNTETEILVRDTDTGTTRRIHNPRAHVFDTVANTSAFLDCP